MFTPKPIDHKSSFYLDLLRTTEPTPSSSLILSGCCCQNLLWFYLINSPFVVLKGQDTKNTPVFTSCLRCCEPFYSLRASCCLLKTSTGRSRASLEPDKEAALGLETVVPEWHRFLCWARENKLLMLKTWGRGCRDEAEATAQYAGSYLK